MHVAIAHSLLAHSWIAGLLFPIIGQSLTSALSGTNLTSLLTTLLTAMAGIIPGATQNQENLQQQSSQRQLSASDLATNPNTFSSQLSNLLGVTGASAGPNSTGANGAGTNTIAGMLQKLISSFTGSSSQNLTNNVWEQLQPQLASAGLGQAPGVANEELATALAPNQIQEQTLGAEEGAGALQSALQTEETNLQFPFQIGSQAASSFPSFATL